MPSRSSSRSIRVTVAAVSGSFSNSLWWPGLTRSILTASFYGGCAGRFQTRAQRGKRERDIGAGMCGADRTLLGSQREDVDAALDRLPPHLFVQREIVACREIVPVHRRVIGEVRAEG